jgi:hypothetical protein
VAWDKDLDKNGVAYKIAAAAGDRIRVIAGPGTGKSYARDQAISDGEIDLDAGNDPDEWNAYLIGIPRFKKA